MKIEKKKLESIIKRIKDVNELIKKENEEKSHEINLGKNNSNIEIDDKSFKKYISLKKLSILEKEKLLIINYTKKLIRILNKQNYKSISLKNNTISYFRRFYLKKSILDYNPKFLMAAAFYLGSKTAQVNITLEGVEKIFTVLKKYNNNKILFDYEFFLCAILEYDFYVYNPYNALIGFIYNLEKKDFFLAQRSESYVNQKEFEQECMDLIDDMYLTNNIFLYSYSEIALASIFIKCRQKNININTIAEKLELDKFINVKDFIEGPMEKMKQNLELIPKYENKEEENEKADEIYESLSNFYQTFPLYEKKLEEERKILKEKMKSFTDDFDDLLKKNGLEIKTNRNQNNK